MLQLHVDVGASLIATVKGRYNLKTRSIKVAALLLCRSNSLILQNCALKSNEFRKLGSFVLILSVKCPNGVSEPTGFKLVSSALLLGGRSLLKHS